MKTSSYIYKIFTITLIFIIMVFSYGCGGSGGGSKTSDVIYTISGNVVLPDLVASSTSNVIALSNGRQAQTSVREKITVRLEQQPSISTTCDEKGNFILKLPKIADSVNLIAFRGNISDSDFRLQRSKDIVLGKESNINAGNLQLPPGKNTFAIWLVDEYRNPIEYARCYFWGFEIQSDLQGIVNFPKFPENVTKVKAVIKASGLKEFTNEFSVFTEDLGPEYIFAVANDSENKTPVIINISKCNVEPEPNQLVDLSLSIVDESKIRKDDRILWLCSDGTFLKDDYGLTNTWKAPPYKCLTNISVMLFKKNYYSLTSIDFAVGKSRTTHSELSLFYPETAAAGQTVRIIGNGFGDEIGKVSFCGGDATIISWKNDIIEVTVPDEAETGKITITTSDNRTLTSDKDFNCIDYKTTISSNYGVPGTVITISGYGFGDKKADNSDLLYDNEKIDNIVSWTNRSIKFKVKELSGATPHTADLDLVIRGRKRSLGEFTVSYIKNVSPLEASHYTYESDIERTVITLTGAGFGESGSDSSNNGSCVKFLTYGENNKEEYQEAEIKSWSDDEIEVYLPTKAQTGNIILNINTYEIKGPVVTIVPASGYSELESARFSEGVSVKNPLFTGVVIKDSEKVFLCDPQNYRLWYLEDDQYNYISTTDVNNVYKPFTGVVNKDGEIILTDLENKTLIKLVDGTITQKSDYVFNGAPYGICMSASTGYIYCADSGANKIIVFDENLAKIDEFGSEGSGNGKFSSPNGVCLNSTESSIFVADSGNHRIQQFDISTDSKGNKEYVFKCWYGSFNQTNGKHTNENEFGEIDYSNLGFSSPTSVACDGSYMYVTDSGRNDIQKINLTNLSCEVFGEEGNGTSQFMAPTDIKLFGTNMYIADSENSRIQIISKTGIFKEQRKPDYSGLNVSFLGISMNSDKDTLYIVDSDDCTVSKFDINGKFEKKIGSKGNGIGQLLNPSDVILDKDNNIWVVDTGNKRLVMFPEDGSEAKIYGSGGSGNNQFKSPQRLACNSQSDIFVSDCDKNVVMRFDKTGKYLYSIGQSELNQPFGLAVDSSDNLYVCDAGNHRICKYDANNQFVGWFGWAKGQEAGGWHEVDEGTNLGFNSGSSPCEFNNPLYLDIDSYDNLYVLDCGNNNVQKLDTNNTGILGGHICTVKIDTDIFGIAVDDKDCFFVTTDYFVRKYVPSP